MKKRTPALDYNFILLVHVFIRLSYTVYDISF